MLGTSRDNAPRREGGMDDAGALPDLHVLAAGLLLHIVAQIDVGQKQNRLLGRNRIHHRHRVARRTKNVAFRLYFDRCVDVADDDVIGMLAFECTNLFDRTTIDQAAARFAIGNHDDARSDSAPWRSRP